eukprot:TRINITY_DN31384_c0_g1_i1.p1 TRINITY_DN31384_c0_g1~~TRINITY_DN31384_c0_g1_i1.p1  ORF type:complete len:692 (+),score=108.39 TRINITY_DN31384_c0_g1_i1:129-2078(+)
MAAFNLGPKDHPHHFACSVASFYKGKTVLLTGATGFLGKVVLERLLWEDMGASIRLLVRGDPMVRLRELSLSPIFDVRLRQRVAKGNFVATSNIGFATDAPFVKKETGAPLADAASTKADIVGGDASDMVVVGVTDGERGKSSAASETGAAEFDNFAAWLASRVDVHAFDLEQDELGMRPYERDAAFSGVDVVLHCAARVSWDERLDVALRANTIGARAMLTAAAAAAGGGIVARAAMPVFVQVSSAFVHGMRPPPHSEDLLPPTSVRATIDSGSAPPFDIGGLISSAIAEGHKVDFQAASALKSGRFRIEACSRLPDQASEDEVRSLETRIAERRARALMSQRGIEVARKHGWYDPYTLSKALAEIYLTADARATGIPLKIVRPSGIIACAIQPRPGWIDAYLLNEPIIEATGRGQLSAFPGRHDTILDMVPADFVTELVLVVAATRPSSNVVASPSVFQLASGDVNPVQQGDLARWWTEYFKQDPFLDKSGCPVTPVEPKLIGTLSGFLARMRLRAQWPVQAASVVTSVLPGRLPWVRRMRARVGKTMAAVQNAMRLACLYSVYTIERFEFKSANTRALLDALPEEERSRWHAADCQDINWKAFFCDLHIPGMRKFVLGEKGQDPKLLAHTEALSRRRRLSTPASRL